jgi:HK97 family phage major capsid protein
MTITKRKVDLRTFNETVLPSLRKTYPKVEDLQAHIDKHYSVFETSEDGTDNTVTISLVSQPTQVTTPAVDVDALIKKAVDASAKAQPAPLPQIEVKPSFMPEGLKLYKSIKHFSGTSEERKLKAYQMGCFILGGVMGMPKYAEKMKEMGMPIRKAQSEGTNTAGGIFVPDELDNHLVDLREQYGIFRGQARVAAMARDHMEFPRRVSGLTASFKAEEAAFTESSKAWDSITLTAKKLTALAKMSNELMEDAIINIGDDLAGEIAYAFAQKEDECGFIGDGTTTYGGIEGASPKLKRIVGATTTSAGGVVVATGNLMSEIVIGDILTLIATLPQYAEMGAKFYCSKFFHWNVLERLERAAGGVTLGEQRTGAVKTAFGYPVVISQVLPKIDANSSVLCLFGDLSKAATFGDRRQTTISLSDQIYWANDQVGIKGTERFDINVHDVGTATVAGPLLALQALNS